MNGLQADTQARLDQLIAEADAQFAEGRFAEAADSFSAAIALSPDVAALHNNFGATLLATGRFAEAAEACSRAVALAPDYADAYFNLGMAYQFLRRPEEAAASLRRATELAPENATAHNSLGIALEQSGRLAEAAESYGQAARYSPDEPTPLYNQGVVLQALNRWEEAFASYRAALRLRPDWPEALTNCGVALEALDRMEEATEYSRRALALNPDCGEACINLANALHAQGQFAEAIASLRQAVAILTASESPELAKARFNLGWMLLSAGEYAEGWAEYEWRLRLPDFAPLHVTRPIWDGSPFPGKTLLVCAEQGIGDSIQFARYLPLAKARGGRVVFECPKELLSLLRDCDGADEIVERRLDGHPPAVVFDLQVQLKSLPFLFHTTLETIPPCRLGIRPSLLQESASPCPPAWARGLETDRLRVGLVWAGNPQHRDDRRRSRRPADFAPLASAEGARFFSLQKGERAREITTMPEEMKITDLAEELRDFTDTARALLALDLLITVDTSPAHLAGALGVPTWTLLPFSADPRWLRARDDSPWYPTMRLFRQPKRGDWESVFARVAHELRALTAFPHAS